MDLFDLTIIYLALGAPLGVYHVATHWGEPARATVSFSVLNIFLWPVAAFVFAHDHLKNAAASTFAGVSQHVQRMNEAAGAVLRVDEAFTFRGSLDKYVGLTEALESEIGTSFVDGVAEVAEFGNIPLAKAVAIRSNREKLFRHQAAARTELMDWVRTLQPADPSVSITAVHLAKCLSDHVMVDEIQELRWSQAYRTPTHPDRMSMAA